MIIFKNAYKCVSNILHKFRDQSEIMFLLIGIGPGWRFKDEPFLILPTISTHLHRLNPPYLRLFNPFADTDCLLCPTTKAISFRHYVHPMEWEASRSRLNNFLFPLLSNLVISCRCCDNKTFARPGFFVRARQKEAQQEQLPSSHGAIGH